MGFLVLAIAGTAVAVVGMVRLAGVPSRLTRSERRMLNDAVRLAAKIEAANRTTAWALPDDVVALAAEILEADRSIS